MQRGLTILIILTLLGSGCSDSDPIPVSERQGTGPISEAERQGTGPISEAAVEPPAPPNRLESERLEEELAKALQLWTERGPDSYHLATWAEAPWGMTTAATVIDGRVHEHRQQGNPETGLGRAPRSMLGLIDSLASVVGQRLDPIQVSFDPNTGAVTRYTRDGTAFRVAVTPLGPDLPRIDTASLTVAHGCYDDLLLTNEEATVGLRLQSPLDADLSDPVDLSTRDRGPKGDWIATISIGHHIFSNLWCLQESEAQRQRPIVHERWNLYDGILTFRCGEGPSCDDPGRMIRATLQDAVVHQNGSLPRQLDDIELTHDCWGCGWE